MFAVTTLRLGVMCREGGRWIGWDVSTSPEKGVWGLKQVLDVTQGGGMREMGVSSPAAWCLRKEFSPFTAGR